MHAVVGIENEKIATRNTSCACDECFQETFNVASNSGWKESVIALQQTGAPESIETNGTCLTGATEVAKEKHENQVELGECESHITDTMTTVNLEEVVNQFVVAGYENMRYIGKVIELCRDDNTIHVNFMSE